LDSEVATRLIDLNRQFYQTFALQFSATRGRLQPGVRRVLVDLPLDKDMLDLGCGNGVLARELAQRGFMGTYLGLDLSEGLLSVACQELPVNFTFLQVDLSSPDWDEGIGLYRFDFVLAFAVFHHLPGQTLRRGLLAGLRAHLRDGGRLIHSEWQFLHSPRLRTRLQPWKAIGLADDQVDEGDYLLDWRAGGHGLRYAHHFSEAELASLAEDSGFHILDTFYSDGEGGRLGLYQVWENPAVQSSTTSTNSVASFTKPLREIENGEV
jgi:tRNA (uracil-5-)-methyltransferase TRM9